MRKIISTLLLLLIGLIIGLFWFLAMTKNHMTALMREQHQEGFECTMSHPWFGRVSVDEIALKWLVPGWSIVFLETQRGYAPVSVADLANSTNWFPGPEAVSFLDLPEGFFKSFLKDLDVQPLTKEVYIARCEAEGRTWALLAKFPNLESLELTATNCTGETLPSFPKLSHFYSDTGIINDEGLKALTLNPRLRRVQIIQDWWRPELDKITAEGVMEFISQCSELESLHVEIHLDPGTVERISQELGSVYPDLTLFLRSLSVKELR